MTTTDPTRDLAAGLAEMVDGEALVALCRDLVRAPSVNPPGDTRQAASVVARFLAAHGIEPEVVAVADTMPSVVATVCGEGRGPHLVLNGHLDTMEVGDKELWSVPPLDLTERDGRLYGLGMGNMKGAVAAMAHAFCLLARHRDRWPGTVTFTAVADEVVFGDNGAAQLLAARPELTGDALLSGEGPGWMRLAVAEKGVLWLELRATGDGGHSSGAEPGQTAIARLARLVSAVDELGGAAPPLPDELRRGREGMADDPSDPGRRLTVNVGTIRGGTFTSQLPREAVAEVDVRLPPGVTMEAFERRVMELCQRVERTSIRRIKGWDPNWTALDDPFVGAVRAAVADVRGAPPVPVVRLPASDASRWRARGVPAVCYGPQPTLSAGIDDYADRADVIDCAKVYLTAALRYLSADEVQGTSPARGSWSSAEQGAAS